MLLYEAYREYSSARGSEFWIESPFLSNFPALAFLMYHTKYLLLWGVLLVVKGIIMSLTVLAVTHDLRDSIIIAAVSATITGTFVVVSGIINSRFTDRKIIDPYVAPTSQRIIETKQIVERLLQEREEADLEAKITELLDRSERRRRGDFNPDL